MTKHPCKAIMFQGTGSDVGKTVLVAGLCRALRNRGLNVRPFKPQNMSNNAAVADMPGEAGGGEIGRAQWLQALACGVAPSVHMNPVLLKPQSETGSQIIVQGKVWGQAKGRDYQRLKPQLLDAVMQSFDLVRQDADIVLVEGAGSPAEINLRAGDIANMGFAVGASVPVVLVGDIDRGGVIASLVGTHTILSDEDRATIKGFIINKFRGDVSLFDDGLTIVENYTGWPCFGVVPWLEAVGRLPAEDSVALEKIIRLQGAGGDKVKIAVPVIGHIANFDDLDPLMNEPGVNLVMVPAGQPLPQDAALVILPGSKSTIADLMAFRKNGWDVDLAHHIDKGGKVIGICGGYQMLGRMVCDPDGIESNVQKIDGLGYLDIETELEPHKTVRNVEGRYLAEDLPLSGYEIHMGNTIGPDCSRAMVEIAGRADGAISADGKVMGCYLHGLFTSDDFRRFVLGSIGVEAGSQTHTLMIDQALDELAIALETHLDVDGLLALAG
jgi:adenosylcobyric acid synthase